MPDLSEILIYTGEVPVTVIIWSLFIGVFIATITAYIIKVKFGIFIRTLLKMQANSPETAVTLEETGLNKHFLVRRGLKLHSNYQSMMVAITDDGRYYANSRYTSIVPVFKTYLIQRRKKKKSVYRDKSPDNTKAETVSADNTSEINDADGYSESAAAKRLRLQQEAEKGKQAAEKTLHSGSENNESDTTESENEEDCNALHDEEYREFIDLTENMPKQRVKFDIDKAKFYIPDELHDRAASIYNNKPTKLIAIIGALIILAVIATFSEKIIDIITELVQGFIESLKPQDKL